MIEVRYFLGKDLGGVVFAVYCASFGAHAITDEKKWQVPNKVGWEDTQAVSKWNFVGDDDLVPSTEEEAKKYLEEA